MSRSVHALLQDTSGELCIFLADVLPQLGESDWWKKLVINQLSSQQQRFVKQRQINELSGLDLAALLRILDKNCMRLKSGYIATVRISSMSFFKMLKMQARTVSE